MLIVDGTVVEKVVDDLVSVSIIILQDDILRKYGTFQSHLAEYSPSTQMFQSGQSIKPKTPRQQLPQEMK